MKAIINTNEEILGIKQETASKVVSLIPDVTSLEHLSQKEYLSLSDEGFEFDQSIERNYRMQVAEGLRKIADEITSSSHFRNNERAKKIVELRYFSQEPMSFKDIAKEVGSTAALVKQLAIRFLVILSHPKYIQRMHELTSEEKSL